MLLETGYIEEKKALMKSQLPPLFLLRDMGKATSFFKKMCYHGNGPLNDNKNNLTKPMSQTSIRKSGDTIGLGYGVDDDFPIHDQEVPIANAFEKRYHLLLFLQHKRMTLSLLLSCFGEKS